MKKFVTADCETGGLDENKNALCSIAVITLDESLNELERFYTLVKDDPSKTIEDQALAVNKLTRREIYEKGMPVKEAMKKVSEMFEGAIPVFHNAAFDARFINARGMKIYSAIDTMRLSYKVWPYPQKAKLTVVVERLGFSVENAHNSLGDVLMTIQLLKKFSENPDLNALTPQTIDFNFKPWEKGR